MSKLILGTYEDGTLKARMVDAANFRRENGESPTHSGLGMHGRGRWRYPVGSNTVFWWEGFNSSSQASVDIYLEKRGYKNLKHKQLIDDTPEDDIANGFVPVPKKYSYTERFVRLFRP